MGKLPFFVFFCWSNRVLLQLYRRFRATQNPLLIARLATLHPRETSLRAGNQKANKQGTLAQHLSLNNTMRGKISAKADWSCVYPPALKHRVSHQGSPENSTFFLQ
jgi:hypothetical protein